MEPVTHFLSGACLSRTGLNRKTGLATLTLTLAAEAPDIDVVAFFHGSVAGFAHHRGFTHTLLGAPLVAAATLAVVYGIYRLLPARDGKPAQPPRWKLLFLYALLGCLLHIFLDFTNNYGVRPFAPFHPQWYSWDILFIFDPIVLAALVLGLMVPGLLRLVTEEIGSRASGSRGKTGALAALLCIAGLIYMRDFQHRRAVNALKARTYQGQDPLRASAYPSPINPFAWRGVVETRDFLEQLPVDSGAGVVDPQETAEMRYKPQETAVTLAAKKSWVGRVYLDWAQYPLVESQALGQWAGYKVRFLDLRFFNLSRGIRHGSSLDAYVVLDPRLRVVDMYVGEGRPGSQAR